MNARFRPAAYARPKDVDEVVSLLGAHGRRAKILAGGTDLLVQRPSFVEVLVDITATGLDGVRDDGAGGLMIGAATQVEALERTEAFTATPFRALSEAVEVMATPTVRNMATVGGNLCNASPAADLSVALTALGAVLRIAGPQGQREIPIEDFFLGPNITALQDDEMLIEIHLPPLPKGTGSSFLKLRHHQTSVDMAIVNVATCLKAKGGLCEDAAVSMGGVGPAPCRASKAEAVLAGSAPDAALIEKAAQAAMEESCPIDDVRASAGYRKRIVAVLVRRSLEASLRRCSA